MVRNKSDALKGKKKKAKMSKNKICKRGRV